MAEGRHHASVGDVDLIAAEDRGSDAAEVSVLARAGIMERVSVAARHLALAGDGGPVKVEALDLAAAEDGDRGKVEVSVLVPAGVRECVPIAARNLISAGAVDLAPAADRNRNRAEVLDLTPTEIKASVLAPEQGRGLAEAAD